MDLFIKLKISLIILFQYGFCEAEPYGCGPGVKSEGYTYPLGDITLQLGQDLNILCVLNEGAIAKYGPNATQYMTYVMGNITFPVEFVNSTTIQLSIKNHPKTQFSNYYCMVNGSLVCHNIVVVGTPPQDVTDFDCIGYNYENITCSWTAPKNYVTTNYYLDYMPSFRPARYYKKSHKAKSSTKAKGTTTHAAKVTYYCPKNLTVHEVNGNTTMSCTWALSTKPQYRHAHENFTFKLFANNTFGNRTWTFPIKHFTRVRPSPPENLTSIRISPHSLKLKWNIPLYMQSYPPGLEHRVSWCIEHRKEWTTVYLKDIKDTKTVQYTLENLPYAHCLYDIRVSMKSKPATEERMWSQNSSITDRTPSKIPDCPPNTTAGSFEVMEGTENKLVYWQSIHYYQENGANFTYTIQVDEDPSIRPVKVHSNYAIFENLPDRNYTFRIWSNNSEGLSSDSSIVFFPAHKYALQQLSKLVKVDRANGTYDLEWTESTDSRVTNYTLFWCSAKQERPHLCTGKLQWKTVPRNVKNITLKLETYDYESKEDINIYQFAISANGYDTSSGLRWAHCTVIPGSGVKLTQIYIKDSKPRYIVLQWKLDCIKLGDIQSFNVSYCTVATPASSKECNVNSLKYKLFNNYTFGIGEGELNVTGLNPHTTYKIQVKPIVFGTESQFSDPMFNITSADTPTEPRNFIVLNRSDRSITIQWEKPLEENGILTHYVISVNGRKDKEVPNVKEQNVYTEEIVDLLPRNDYAIQVEACTTSCSKSLLHASTDIGYPGLIPKPSANWDNYSLIIKWEKPDEIGVKVDGYEVEVGTTKTEKRVTYNTTDQFYEIKLCQHDKSQTVNVRIRAVNLRDGLRLKGNWSEKADFPCFRNPSSSSWMVPIVVMSVIVIIALMSFAVKKVWRKILGMRNCPVKLPPGLDAVVNNFEPKEKHSDETLPGEPLLPEKFSQPRNPSGETSGCCSGSESVTSSVESAGHLSLSDSGTEQPRSPSLGESDHKDVSLRQRPNVKKPDYVTMTDIPQTPWCTKPTQSGYSVIGLSTPLKKPDLDSDYMPLSDMPLKTSYVPFPIVQSQEPIKESPTKTPTSGYVPYLSQEPASKNTAYVLAGEPTVAKPAMKLAPKTPVYTQNDDSSSGYVKAPPIETPKLLFPWRQQASLEPPSTGYVVVGDTKPQKTDLGVQKGSNKSYVPHNLKFDTTKSLKED